MRCLLVDDSSDFLASATLLLESQGVEIVGCASSGAEALRLTEALEPDVVLVDVELGEEDGIALTRTLEASAPSSRIVLISAHDRSDLGDMLSDGRALRFLPKSDLGAEAIARLLP